MEEAESLFGNADENRKLLENSNRCDKYDYLAAIACGVIGGIVDILLVGAPGDSLLGNWSDEQVEKVVKSFARRVGWSPRDAQRASCASAIGYLEKKYKVNYDQRYSSDVKDLFHMTTRNHHMMSLAHSPDPVGLFFSVINQFTATSSFIAKGQVITIETETFELCGGNFVAKLFCGIANWFGHLISDIAGSSGSVGNGGRGTGIVIPFYELFQFCTFGRFSVGKDKQDFATIAVRAFQEGYDLRYGAAMAVPAVLTDLSVRLIWSIRRYFQYGKEISDCVPTSRHDELRVMLLFGNGTLCAMDGIEAGVRSGGNFLIFFMRLNLVAWCRFAVLVIKEIGIRSGIADSVLWSNLDAYRKINEILSDYLEQIKQVDIKRFEEEGERHARYVDRVRNAQSEEELRQCLQDSYASLGLELPWQGNFNEFMQDRTNQLVF